MLQGLGFRAYASGFRVEGLGFRGGQLYSIRLKGLHMKAYWGGGGMAPKTKDTGFGGPYNLGLECLGVYLNPKSMQNKSHKPIITAVKAIILYTFGLQPHPKP